MARRVCSAWVASVALVMPFLSTLETRAQGPEAGPQLLRVQPNDKTRAVLSVRVVEDLDFGKAVADQRRGGSLVIHADSGQLTSAGGAQSLGGRHSRAEFVVQGEPNTRFTILLPDEVRMDGGRGRTHITGFTSIPSSFGTTDSAGRAKVYIGASLVLQPNQPAGIYHGRYDLLVDER